MSATRRTRLRNVAAYINRGVAPTYVEEPTGVVAFSQKCIRQDRSVDPSLGRPIADPGLTARSAVLRVGDICVNSTGTGTLGRVGLIEPRHLEMGRLVADGHITVVRVDERIVDPRFVWYQLCTEHFYDLANSTLAVGATNQTELGRDALGMATIVLPDVREQQRVVAFLDSETSIIDALLEEQEKLATLLMDRLRRLISIRTNASVVVRLNAGADPPFPPGWRSMQLARCLASAEYGVGEAAREAGEVAVLGMVNVNDSGAVVGSPAGYVDVVATSLLLMPGDLLFNRTNSLAKVGKVGLVRELPGPTTVASYLVILRVNDLVTPEYLNYMANTEEFLGVARSVALPSVNQANLNPTRYGRLKIVVPPLAEQMSVVRDLDAARRHSESVLAEIESQRLLLLERRQSLIAAAVQGGLDAVRKVA